VARLGHAYPRRRDTPAEVTRSASVLTPSAVSTRSRCGCPLPRRYFLAGKSGSCRESRLRMLLSAKPGRSAVSLIAYKRVVRVGSWAWCFRHSMPGTGRPCRWPGPGRHGGGGVSASALRWRQL